VPAGSTIADALRHQDVRYSDVCGADGLPAELGERVTTEIRYESYIKRQHAAVERLAKSENVRVPAGFDFGGCSGLSREAKEKLSAIRPQTLGQAGRIPGVTPADVGVLAVYLHRQAAVAAG
jgi:tRNA uridine 5-carboxymethylaminomethyl modification enzyme